MLSVIIPTAESERALVRTLGPLVAGATAGLVREVIVADAGSADDTASVADIAGCRMLVSHEPLGARLATAAAAARGAWLMFLRPGTVLDPGWVDAVARFTQRAATSERAAAFRPTADPQRPALTEIISLLRAALGARPRPEQGLLIARAHYDALGGHTADAADPEGDLVRRLGRRRVAILGCGAVTAD
jgi:glycosyltransferase involved in cell wall biosynthesis